MIRSPINLASFAYPSAQYSLGAPEFGGMTVAAGATQISNMIFFAACPNPGRPNDDSDPDPRPRLDHHPVGNVYHHLPSGDNCRLLDDPSSALDPREALGTSDLS